MKLELKRNPTANGCTIGDLFVNGVFECYTLEDEVRDEKIHGKTAIPAGTYEVIITFSPRFQRDLPLLVGVPNFEGVRIHPGNTAADTEGCILPGQSCTANSVGASRLAFEALFRKIKDAKAKHEGIWLTVS